ncbi:MAG: hypothetical protein AAF674_07150 [Pseudomonadota bacterium]
MKQSEIGHIALDHADRFFSLGEELLAGSARNVQPLKVGALSTLSRNVQLSFLRPIIAAGDVELVLKSGINHLLFDQLQSLASDVVLTTEPPPSSAGYRVHRIAEQPVSVHGVPELRGTQLSGRFF